MMMITAEMIQCFAVQSCINIEVAPFTIILALILALDCIDIVNAGFGVGEKRSSRANTIAACIRQSYPQGEAHRDMAAHVEHINVP